MCATPQVVKHWVEAAGHRCSTDAAAHPSPLSTGRLCAQGVQRSRIDLSRALGEVERLRVEGLLTNQEAQRQKDLIVKRIVEDCAGESVVGRVSELALSDDNLMDSLTRGSIIIRSRVGRRAIASEVRRALSPRASRLKLAELRLFGSACRDGLN
jgi:hypothetical protein